MQWRWKWGEEKGQYGDVDLFVDCKEGDSIEWILPLAVTYIGREDAERSICFFALLAYVAWRLKMTKRTKLWMDWFEDITYIERKNTESIVLFNVARGPKLVKCALCHPEAQDERRRAAEHNLWSLQTLWNYHPSRTFDRKELLKKAKRKKQCCFVWSPGEHIDHGVNPVFLVSIRKGHHFNSIGEERPVKKSVEEKHLTLEWDVNGWSEQILDLLHQRDIGNKKKK